MQRRPRLHQLVELLRQIVEASLGHGFERPPSRVTATLSCNVTGTG
jgi:hypothetical protein